MKNHPHQAVLERARHFDIQALEEIFDTYSPKIYRYAFRLLGDKEVAGDCMAETFSRFLTALRHGNGPHDYLQAYLYRIAHNWITDYYRSKVPPPMPLVANLRGDPSDEPHHRVASEMERDLLRNALFLLTADQRQVLVMHYLEDCPHEVIARALDKPIGAVKALQHRGLRTLRRILVRNEDIPE